MGVKAGAKPPITNYGYRTGSNVSNDIKIATSNLFIETGTTPVDYMTGAVFDSIGGNEFINSGSSETILQSENTLIQNASDVLEAISSKTNEKQSDGTASIMSQFELSLPGYLPMTTSHKDYTGSLDTTNDTTKKNTAILVSFPEKNAYFEDTYAYIYIELQNIDPDEEVEIEFITSADVTSGII